MKCKDVTLKGKKCKNSVRCFHHSQKGGSYRSMTLPPSVKFALQGINLAAKEIPVGGEAVALIEVIESNAKFIYEFLELVKTSQILKNLMVINFNTGPLGVQQQFEQLWLQIPPSEYGSYCKVVPALYEDLQNAICDWIETIPVIGPPTSALIKTIGGFKLMNDIYKGLPAGSRQLFQNPEGLHQVMKNVVLIIENSLNLPPEDPLIGGNFLSDLGEKIVTGATAIASSTLVASVTQNFNRAALGVKIATAPFMAGLSAVGGDKILANTIRKYLKLGLQPAINGAVKSLKIIFPLYFALLCLVDKCRLNG
jgi:hypothetical protein